MEKLNTLFQPTGILAADLIGAAFTHTKDSGRTIQKFTLRKPLYARLKKYMAVQMDNRGLKYTGTKLVINGIPVEYSAWQNEPLVIEYK